MSLKHGNELTFTAKGYDNGQPVQTSQADLIRHNLAEVAIQDIDLRITRTLRKS